MVDYVRNQFTFHVLDGLKERAAALGVELVSRSIAGSDDQIALLEEAATDPAVVGCLFLTLDDEAVLTLTGGFPKPVVLVNGDDPAMRHSSVTPCNRSAARLAAQHLVGLGHRRILFLMRRGRRTIERRFEGWQDALRESGLDARRARARSERLASGTRGRRYRPTHRGPRARLHRGARRRRQPCRGRHDGGPESRLPRAGRCLGHGHGRPAASGLPEPAADDDAHPDAGDRRGLARPAPARSRRPAPAAEAGRIGLPSRRAAIDGRRPHDGQRSSCRRPPKRRRQRGRSHAACRRAAYCCAQRLSPTPSGVAGVSAGTRP